MSIDINDVFSAFHGSLPLYIKAMSEFCHVTSLEVQPPTDSPLHLTDDAGQATPLYLPMDQCIGRIALFRKAWDPIKQEMFAQIMPKDRPLGLIDVGANVGLFSRQCLHRLPAIGPVFCYEPHPLNYRLLTQNLRGRAQVRTNHYGLGPSAGQLDFYMDPINQGNYSLNKAAMPANFQTIQVAIRSATEESQRWMREWDGEFIYKSDTQGHDELILTSIDPAFWDRVRCGVMELWQLKDKTVDAARLAAVLDRFPNKVMEKDPTRRVSTQEVIDFVSKDEGGSDDLFFWR